MNRLGAESNRQSRSEKYRKMDEHVVGFGLFTGFVASMFNIE